MQAEQAQARSRQLDGQGNAIQVAADTDRQGGVGLAEGKARRNCLGALDQEGKGFAAGKLCRGWRQMRRRTFGLAY